MSNLEKVYVDETTVLNQVIIDYFWSRLPEDVEDYYSYANRILNDFGDFEGEKEDLVERIIQKIKELKGQTILES